MTARRRKPIEAPKADPVFEAKVREMFPELNDLKDGAPIVVEPGRINSTDVVHVQGTLWDGRELTETYARESSGEIFVVKGIGVRYRVVEGDYYHGRKRKFAAFLVGR